MLRLLPVALCVLVGTLWLGAAGPALDTPAIDRALADIRPAAIRGHMRFLASDLLEGRGTGTRGYRLAAAYVAAQFEVLGLEPGGVDGSYFQPVPLRRSTVVKEGCALVLRREGKETEMVFGEDYVMLGDPLRTDSRVTAPVVFVGYGVTAPGHSYDDYAGIDARGKVVALWFGAPASFPHDERAHYSSSRVKAENAVLHGAVGMIALPTPASEKRLPWERVQRYVARGTMDWLDPPTGEPGDTFPELKARAVFSRAGAEALLAGAPRSLEELDRMAEKGEPESFALPVRLYMTTQSRHQRLTSPNVAGVLPGSDPALADQYVVYTAHLDHLGEGRPVEGDAIYNGALDNASGVAALLETARALAALPEPPRRSVLFLAVTAEERGLLGSDYFVHQPTVPGENIVANVNLDLATMFHPLKDVVAFGAEHSSLGEVVRQAAARLRLQLSPDPMPDETLFVRSDQYSFVRRGIPAVFLVVGFETGDPETDGGRQLRRWLKAHYHQPSDDMSQGLDFEAGADFARVNFLIGYLVANRDERPRWNPGNFFGEKFGRPGAAKVRFEPSR